jgi:hypothetical protein
MKNANDSPDKEIIFNSKDSDSFIQFVIKAFNLCCDIGYVILPSVGYMHQYMKIIYLKKTEGFSKLVSFILIMSYIFRIFFWIGQHFEKSILFNSIFGILVQLLLLRVCLKFDTKLQNNRSFWKFLDIKEFWNWPYFSDYLIFIVFISILITMISLIIGFDNKPYVFILGVITSAIESFSDVPQIYELYSSKNPYTVSYLLIFFWLSGDTFKVGYFFCRDTPIQLIICAIFQLTTDIILTIQIIYYRYINRKKSKDNNVISKDEESENSGTKDSNLLYKTINSDLANNLKI